MKDRHDSVSRRKRVRMSTKPIQSDSSSDVTDRRRTRSKSLLILQETEHREEEKKNVQERDTSLEMSKEEFVKSYNLRRKDFIPKMSEKSENDESNRKSKGDNEKGKTHGKSENTVGRKKGSKDTEQKLSSGNIASKSDSIKGMRLQIRKKMQDRMNLMMMTMVKKDNYKTLTPHQIVHIGLRMIQILCRKDQKVLHLMTQRKIPILMLKRKNRKIVK